MEKFKNKRCILKRYYPEYLIAVDGNVTDVKVLNGVSSDIKEEVITLINRMPSWRSGIRNGKPVKVQFTMPIKFNLN